MNLRPPGPQPGALPDCATPRGVSSRAGDGNRTRPRSLEGFCATTTLRPQADGPMIAVRGRVSGPRAALLGRARSPASSSSDGGGQGPNQLSRAPSSVMTEPESARPSGDAASATSQACSSSRPRRWSGTVRAAARQTGSGYLRSDAVSKWPAASASTAMPSARPLARERARVALDGGAGGARVRHPGQPVVGRERDVDDRAAAGRAHRELGARRGSSARCRRR